MEETARAALVSPREEQAPVLTSIGDHKRSYDDYLELEPKTEDNDEEKENGQLMLVKEDNAPAAEDNATGKQKDKKTPELNTCKKPASASASDLIQKDNRAESPPPDSIQRSVLAPTSPVTPRTSNVHVGVGSTISKSRKRHSSQHLMRNRNHVTPMTPMQRAQWDWNNRRESSDGSSYVVNGNTAIYYPSYSPMEAATSEHRYPYERMPNLAWRGHRPPPQVQYFPHNAFYQEGFPGHPPAYPWQEQQQQQQMRVQSPFYYQPNGHPMHPPPSTGSRRSLSGPVEANYYHHFYGRHSGPAGPSQSQATSRNPRSENCQSPPCPPSNAQGHAEATASATTRHSTSTPVPFTHASSSVDRDFMSPSPPPPPPPQQQAATMTHTPSYNSERARHHLDKVLQTITANTKSRHNEDNSTATLDSDTSASSLAEAMDALTAVLYCGRPTKTKVDDLCQVLFHSYPNAQPEVYRETLIRESLSFLRREGVLGAEEGGGEGD